MKENSMENLVSEPSIFEHAPEAGPEARPTARLSQASKEPGRTLGFYRQALSKNLSPEIMKPNPARLGWYALSAFLSVGSYFMIVQLSPAWPIKLGLGLLIGFCNGLLAFITHELSHGSIIKNQKMRDFLSFFGTLPFLIAPTYWKFSHNRLHHGKTQKLIEDPDAFPTLRLFQYSRFMKFMFPYTPGSGHKRSFAYFFFWFSFHNFAAQTSLRFKNRAFDPMNHRRVTFEFCTQIAILVGMLAYAGPSNWLWVLVLPMAVQNYLLMSYISTNHNLSPLTSVNDPLANSLSVSNHPIFEFLTFNFGYHVEHHIFPTVNGKHVKAVHHELVKQFPQSYKIMPKSKAMKALYNTPRIYKNSRELVHPHTNSVHDTI
jgi:fatty acid desaturase